MATGPYVFSADSSRIAAPGASLPQTATQKDREFARYATDIFRVENLKERIGTIPPLGHAAALAFDVPRKRIYVVAEAGKLLVFTPDGVRQKEYGFLQATGEGKKGVDLLALHPSEPKLLALTPDSILWVEIVK